MDFINQMFIEHSALQSIIVVAIICAIGLTLGKIKVCGISLGVTFVFFIGILAGHLGFTIDAATLNYIESSGLVLFVYALGLGIIGVFFAVICDEAVRAIINLFKLRKIMREWETSKALA